MSWMQKKNHILFYGFSIYSKLPHTLNTKLALFLQLYRNLNHAVEFVLEKMVRSLDFREFITVRYQWRCINLARLDEAQNLRAIAAIHAARLEGQKIGRASCRERV